MNRVVVFDTNVLLADPNAILSFPRADIVIPETVLGELDKLKTARVDPDLRFRGREVSRILFDLSEMGSLVDGVDLPDGGTLRVAPFDSDTGLPSGLAARNADDRILGAVYQVREQRGPDVEVSLITNDLNMLLKAQTLGITVERYGDGLEGGFARRYIIRPFQRYRIPITILAVAVAVFVGVIAIAIFAQPRTAAVGTVSVPPELKNLLTPAQQSAFDSVNALANLQNHPKDAESLRTMAIFYYDQYGALNQTDPATALDSAQQAIRYFDRYLAIEPQDNDARVDEAVLFFYTAQVDKAIQLVSDVLKADKNHAKANYNLGVFLWQSQRRDFKGAAAQFERVIALADSDPRQAKILSAAQDALAQVRADAAAAGRPLETSSTTTGVTTK